MELARKRAYDDDVLSTIWIYIRRRIEDPDQTTRISNIASLWGAWAEKQTKEGNTVTAEMKHVQELLEEIISISTVRENEVDIMPELTLAAVNRRAAVALAILEELS
jgi:hypothetical protein